MAFILRGAFPTLLAALACVSFAFVPASPAQTAAFDFDDHNGPADAGSYPPGASFTLSLNLSFTPGGNIANLAGLSYWFEQQSPLAPFNFSITNRAVTGSPFTSLQSPGLAYPQSLTPSNPSDLGGITPSGSGFGAGTYFIADLTFSIAPSTAPGVYIIENVTTGGKKSVVTDSGGHIFAIPHAGYTLTVVQFKITSITFDGQDLVLECAGVPNRVNRIEASPDLSPNSFQTIGSVMADSSGTFSFPDTNPGTQQFYRLAFP